MLLPVIALLYLGARAVQRRPSGGATTPPKRTPTSKGGTPPTTGPKPRKDEVWSAQREVGFTHIVGTVLDCPSVADTLLGAGGKCHVRTTGATEQEVTVATFEVPEYMLGRKCTVSLDASAALLEGVAPCAAWTASLSLVLRDDACEEDPLRFRVLEPDSAGETCIKSTMVPWNAEAMTPRMRACLRDGRLRVTVITYMGAARQAYRVDGLVAAVGDSEP